MTPPCLQSPGRSMRHGGALCMSWGLIFWYGVKDMPGTLHQNQKHKRIHCNSNLKSFGSFLVQNLKFSGSRLCRFLFVKISVASRLGYWCCFGLGGRKLPFGPLTCLWFGDGEMSDILVEGGVTCLITFWTVRGTWQGFIGWISRLEPWKCARTSTVHCLM